MRQTRFIIVTGYSGAGKTQAMRILEDMGFFCVDNLPPMLIPKFAELVAGAKSDIRRVAVAMDIRGREFFDEFFEALGQLERTGFPYQIVFLEANDSTLVKRYKETRRSHPLSQQGRILGGIMEEKKRLEEVRGRAQILLDTSHWTVGQLREKMQSLFALDGKAPEMTVNLVSFGFKHGLPMDADLVFDARFLPNPHYVDSLRYLTGEDEAVREYVLKWPTAQQFVDQLHSMLTFLLPQYANEGKAQVAVAIGCTGGQHRSVVLAERLSEILSQDGVPVRTEHRDLPRADRGGRG